MSNFGFISDPALKGNLDTSFNYILILTQFLESKDYSPIVKSSFRKTIIIYTASIIEALLFNIMKDRCTKEDFNMTKWEIEKEIELYKVNSDHRIIGAHQKLKSSVIDVTKMNLGQINKFLCDKKIISDDLFKAVNKVRVLRNDQHLGTQTMVKEYKKDDLNLVFSVAKEVKKLAQN